jgi:TRAP-type mannitol/chloroaromatic compound transport system permease large subunit
MKKRNAPRRGRTVAGRHRAHRLGRATIFVLLALILLIARGVSPKLQCPMPLIVGGCGRRAGLHVRSLFIGPLTGPGATFLILGDPDDPCALRVRQAMGRLAQNELLRVVFPPLVLIVAVLGSILGGITNPTPAAALGAAGAIMLAAYRKLKEETASPRS